VDEVGLADARREKLPDTSSGEGGSEKRRAIDNAAAAPGYPRDRTGKPRPSTRARRVGDVFHVVAASRRPIAELPGEQRVGGLIRREVRRDVKNAHQPA
jgi:hypothetical protein